MHEFYNQHNHSLKIKFKENINTINEILNHSELPFLELKFPFTIPYEEMLKEAISLKDKFVYHRASGNHKGWRSLVIHGLSSTHTEHYTKYNIDAKHDWTDICEYCPATYNFFKNTFNFKSYERIRFMLLEPQGFINPHNDADRYYLGPINIALNNPMNCHFVMKDYGIIPFKDGQANKLALVNEHMVYNNSNEDRYHIIVHGVDNWDDIIINSYKAMKEKHS